MYFKAICVLNLAHLTAVIQKLKKKNWKTGYLVISTVTPFKARTISCLLIHIANVSLISLQMTIFQWFEFLYFLIIENKRMTT